MVNGTSKRLAADERSTQIREAAVEVLRRKGVKGFSLEAVAREAGVALSLPRHYFRGYRDLLRAATEDLLMTIETVLIGRVEKVPMEQRFIAYLDLLAANPWGHHVWMRSTEIHPDIDALVRNARCRMAEAMYRRPYSELTRFEQIDARGRIAYIEAIVEDWLEFNTDNRDVLLTLMMKVITVPPRQVGSKLEPYSDSSHDGYSGD